MLLLKFVTGRLAVRAFRHNQDFARQWNRRPRLGMNNCVGTGHFADFGASLVFIPISNRESAVESIMIVESASLRMVGPCLSTFSRRSPSAGTRYPALSFILLSLRPQRKSSDAWAGFLCQGITSRRRVCYLHDCLQPPSKVPRSRPTRPRTGPLSSSLRCSRRRYDRL